jgi:Haem-binding domain
MRKIIRTALLILLAALIIIQFMRPQKNISEGVAINDISSKFAIPGDVQDILKVACNDCHTNNSRYPWYWNIQPVMWFMNGHIEEGKRHLNFSIFTSFKIARQYKLLDNINKEIKSGDMPLTSYTLIHRDAILSEAKKAAVLNWTTASRKKIEDSFPPDSLKVNKDMHP